jgi:N-acetylmuramoyl-L-alanine amidase
MLCCRCLWLPLLLLGFVGAVALEAQDLEVWLGDRKREVDGRRIAGIVYYRVRDLARAFGLEAQESRGRLRLSGARGQAELVPGRPLVAVSGQYVLLDAEVRLQGSDWWVPQDFLDKILAGLLDRKLERMGPSVVRLQEVVQNRVRVKVYAYPDHLALVFDSTQPAPVEVRDFRDHVDVSFREFLTEPELIATPDWPSLIREIQFLPGEGMGTFRITKGPEYLRLRDYRLQDPPRLVLEFYPRPQVASAGPGADQPPSPPSARPPAPAPAPTAPVVGSGTPRPAAARGGIVLDPGHGGEDSGAAVAGLVEKDLVLDLARRVERRLSERGRLAHLTRNRDVELALEQRSAVANYFRAGAYVGLHVAGSHSPELRGPVVYVHTASGSSATASVASGTTGPVLWENAQGSHQQSSGRLAILLQEELNRLYGTQNTVQSIPLAVLAPVATPAVIVEAGFLTNNEDYLLLATPGFLDRVADALVQALLRFEAD